MLSSASRLAIIKRAQVWRRVDVASMDLRVGPTGSGAFAPDDLVTCDFVDKPAKGKSPKFTCALDREDHVKVKFGQDNGEVYAEVAATRLLWALGFGADRMYPVRVVCRGCPSTLGGRPYGSTKDRFFDHATIERKMPGHEIVTREIEGWSWNELDLVDEAAGGAPKSQRDALKLLAAMIQHTDSKPEQQRLACLDPIQYGSEEPCTRAFMLINDLGMTFGRASEFNSNDLSGANLELWSKTKVWKDDRGCVANLKRSATGTLEDPVIGEDGREFLAGLLMQLTDRQLSDLFDVAHFADRPRAPHEDKSPAATVDDWVRAFDQKRTDIVNRRCAG